MPSRVEPTKKGLVLSKQAGRFVQVTLWRFTALLKASSVRCGARQLKSIKRSAQVRAPALLMWAALVLIVTASSSSGSAPDADAQQPPSAPTGLRITVPGWAHEPAGLTKWVDTLMNALTG